MSLSAPINVSFAGVFPLCGLLFGGISHCQTILHIAPAQFDAVCIGFQFSISDGLSGIKSYNGYLNGKWILFEYDNKTKKITHNFSDGIVAEGANELKIIVVDNLGNSTIFETRFFRSQKNKN